MEKDPPLPLSDLGLAQWLRLIAKAEVIGFDSESEGLKVHDDTDKCLGFSIAFDSSMGRFKEYFPIGHHQGPNLTEAQWRPILDLVVTKKLVFHNAIHDLNVLWFLGYDTSKIQFWDSLKFGHLINENHKTYDLDNTCVRWLGYKGKNKSPLFNAAMVAYGWKDMPSEYMYDYGKDDAGLPLDIIQLQVAHKEATPQLIKYWQTIEAPSIRLLTKMRRAGVRIDLDRCKQQELIGLDRMAQIEDELGGKPSAPTWLKEKLHGELGLPEIYHKKTGKVTFDKTAMERYELMLARMEGNNELAGRILEYRGWQKGVSGYYQAYQKHVSPDGRLRAEYKPHGTVTGRFSCADPNLQQIPKETNKPWNNQVKSCIIPTPGYGLWEFDYSQLEFRLAASASKEQSLIDIFNDPNRDIFNEMAAVLGMTRQNTKTLNYTIQYGGGKTRISDVFGVSSYEAEDIIFNYYDKYPNLKKASDHMAMMAKRNGFVDIWSGRRRHFQNPQKEHYKAFNSYIQGGAADLVKQVMVWVDKEANNEECGLRLQVHDSLVFEIKQGREDYWGPIIQEIMTRPQFGVRLAVDMHPWANYGLAA